MFLTSLSMLLFEPFLFYYHPPALSITSTKIQNCACEKAKGQILSASWLSMKRFHPERIGKIGGDEENRTPVRNSCHRNFSERILYTFLSSPTPAGRLRRSDLDEKVSQALRELNLRYPAIVLLSVTAGERRTEVSLKRLKRSLR